jgi:hypothetical protein
MIPLVLRKLLTHATISKPQNQIEFESIRTELLSMKRDDALELFNYLFDKPYQHLTIDTRTNELRKNFKLIDIEIKYYKSYNNARNKRL